MRIASGIDRNSTLRSAPSFRGMASTAQLAGLRGALAWHIGPIRSNHAAGIEGVSCFTNNRDVLSASQDDEESALA